MAHNFTHFTGKSGKQRKRKKSSRKQRFLKRGTHANKYAGCSSRHELYNPRDKSFRWLPLDGAANETIKAGLTVLFHGRRYRLKKDVFFPESGTVLGPFELIGNTK
ncbi:MAG: hypothetical protein PHG23_03490 [Candidatus Pacebacteria bacterium]|nr:hypothetical protein [Candidatus Paceibacterota bacterium]